MKKPNECVGSGECIRRYDACDCARVSRKISDLIVTSLALLVLFAMLISINPDLRERTRQFAADPQGSALQATITHGMMSGIAVIHGYAGDHTYLFTFLIAACLFTVLMLKVIS